MDLKIKDVAELLSVSETTVRRWLSEGKIPAYRLHHQYRFSRIEIEDWMMSCRLEKEGEGDSLFKEAKSTGSALEKKKKPEESVKKGMSQFNLYRAIHSGQVLDTIDADNKESLIAKTMEAVAEDLSLDPTVISEMLMDRERMMPTALNHGIAVPHTRDFLLKGPKDVIVVVFPKKPIDWGALDQKPVHTLFFLFASNDKRHLNLLAKLAHLSSSDEALEFLSTRPEKQELLEYVREWEAPKT